MADGKITLRFGIENNSSGEFSKVAKDVTMLQRTVDGATKSVDGFGVIFIEV